MFRSWFCTHVLKIWGKSLSMPLKATYSEFDLGHILKAFSLQILQCLHLIIQCRVKMNGGVMHDPSSILQYRIKL
jgi:hypothetical protein